MASTTSTVESSDLDVSQFRHTPFYCEENVYFLCKKLCTNRMGDAREADLFVVFISNEKKQIPLWHQKTSKRADGLVLWDYHVICVQRKKEGEFPFLVWDLDSTLPLPLPLGSYVSQAIRPSFQISPEFQRLFRIIHAPILFRHFASDRRHMKDSNGNWMAKPPDYEAIVAEDGTIHNLNEYMEIKAANVYPNNNIDVKDAIFSWKLGAVVNDLEEFFSHIL
ncbi:protein N-terminal glutamine amidohydrolase isoform X2 [Benincasa hispida]|uniref:protein N-terminal glutamine amidohydrolase isoform X2 n=1 Tax=Benincasa hispida TaxID=102211 RepID=UPI00190143EE|nr:protein N-terminal glutamine amidohydrolase isoform X2 [Benincasa hispida]XP_038904911.1 protein N-terminal glutamine amidohydrolase isoform X2 [Benincasa hispida]